MQPLKPSYCIRQFLHPRATPPTTSLCPGHAQNSCRTTFVLSSFLHQSLGLPPETRLLPPPSNSLLYAAHISVQGLKRECGISTATSRFLLGAGNLTSGLSYSLAAAPLAGLSASERDAPTNAALASRLPWSSVCFVFVFRSRVSTERFSLVKHMSCPAAPSTASFEITKECGD